MLEQITLTAPMSNSKLQTDINGLRAISVLMVVLYHFNLRIASGGFIGVDVFFVISGYLMTKIIFDGMLARRFHYGEFLLKRALRIFPALFAVVLALLLAGAVLLPPADLDNLAAQCLRALLFVSNTYYAGQQGYFSAGLDDRWLLHTWSLSVEWQFYMLYPLIIWAGLKLDALAGADGRHRVFKLFLAAIAAASLALCIVADNQSAFFSVATRSWQMIAGGLVYLARDLSWLRPLRGRVPSYGGVALILASPWVVHMLQLEQRWPSYYAMLPVAGACLLLAARFENNVLLNNPVMNRLGAWSYSIYLWHWPIVIALTISGLVDTSPKLAKLVGIPLSILLGYLSYRYIEPMRRLRAARAVPAAAALCAAGGVLLGVSAIYNATGGLEQRVSDPAVFQATTAASRAATYPEQCENRMADNSRFCHLNQGSTGNKVLVLGDSHAGHLYSWFAAHSKSDTTFYVKSGCPVIPGFELKGQDRSCRAYTKAAFALAASGAYRTVILSQNWTGFSPTATGICTVENGRCLSPAEAGDTQLPVTRTRAALQNLLDKHIRVVVADATPQFSFNVPKTIARQYYWHHKLVTRAPSPELLEKNREFDQLFAQLGRDPNFALVSLRKDLCQGVACRVYDDRNRMPVFIDKDHFNPAWIALHGERFAPFVATALH
ncbi:O-acetyltransferase OatA [Duganella phyllosphaerae]|uniref:O-acetyltransferase OatA n=2 Tax=Duganella phyllosphaerae TaxID=762836 RepID=A0A1E7X124_9BURK|nr:O-acetyltransferase OatA [Duganella phyllosphaerae]